ncbi:MAG: hypothetical protein Q8P46_17445 [Hyphomicrobiales bacterium]|nr:hypothetical protein [Hyphomicrobiales bacterium]
MIRIVNLVAIMAVILSSFALYRVKYEAVSDAKKVAALRAEIAAEEDTIAVLNAEWSHLNQPGRLQGLSDRYLDLKPVDVHQIITLQDLPQRPSEPDPYGDARSLGGFAGGGTTMVR